jgi:hypothetical protein
MVAERAFARAAAAGHPFPAAAWLAPLLLVEGRWDALYALAPGRRSNAHPQAESAVLGLAPLAFARADWDLARLLLAALPNGAATAPGDTIYLEGQTLQRLAARIAIEAGDLPTAQAWLEAHDRWLHWSGAVLGRADGALGWAAYHHANHDPASARAAAEQALAHASDPRQPLALLAVHRFLGKLDTEAAQFDAAEANLTQSLALADACAAPFERALTLLEIARLRMAQNRPDDARFLLAEVQAICTPLEAKPTLEHVAELEHALESAGQEPHHV